MKDSEFPIGLETVYPTRTLNLKSTTGTGQVNGSSYLTAISLKYRIFFDNSDNFCIRHLYVTQSYYTDKICCMFYFIVFPLDAILNTNSVYVRKANVIVPKLCARGKLTFLN